MEGIRFCNVLSQKIDVLLHMIQEQSVTGSGNVCFWIRGSEKFSESLVGKKKKKEEAKFNRIRLLSDEQGSSPMLEDGFQHTRGYKSWGCWGDTDLASFGYLQQPEEFPSALGTQLRTN